MSYKNNSKVYHEADIRNDYRKLTKFLIEKNLTITTMESATSGQIASLITDTEGSSAVLKGAFVTYCNEAKIMQGVPAGNRHSAETFCKRSTGRYSTKSTPIFQPVLSCDLYLAGFLHAKRVYCRVQGDYGHDTKGVP